MINENIDEWFPFVKKEEHYYDIGQKDGSKNIQLSKAELKRLLIKISNIVYDEEINDRGY